MGNILNLKNTSLMRRAMCLLGAFVLGGVASANNVTDSPAVLQDKRYERLESFFRSFGCPAPHYVNEYLWAADANAIDYRLLPVISILESTCGIHQRLNNRWGWASARWGFSSFRVGLDHIARQLAVGRYYKNKTLEEKVQMYNPNPQYFREVKRLMRKIDDRSTSVTDET